MNDKIQTLHKVVDETNSLIYELIKSGHKVELTTMVVNQFGIKYSIPIIEIFVYKEIHKENG